jgi:uncharacterized protein (DUF305 family)
MEIDMNRASFAIIAALIAAPAGLSAHGARAEDSMGMGMNSAGSPADRAFAASMQAMMKNMRTKPTGDPDKDFVLMMMPHHQGAIDMAKVELQYGSDPEMKRLATDIVAAQEKEIAQMKEWLAAHGK